MKADPAQIQQVLINLVVNARDAMPQGGKIIIETAEVVVDEEFASRHVDVRPGDYVTLSVSDNGEGIEAKTLSHIFEPFFTTKQEGKGTGLGLSTTYGIVKQSGGHITVDSTRGKGTTFRIYLPKLAADDDNVRTPHSEQGVHQSETILLVEDESALRRLIRAMLEKSGYRVLEAKDGGEALSICQQKSAIDLVVSDLVMPRMTGLQLREQVALLRPETKFLLISGYAEDVGRSPEEIAKLADFLEKPFLTEELTRKVCELLNGTPKKHEEAGSNVPVASQRLDKGTVNG